MIPNPYASPPINSTSVAQRQRSNLGWVRGIFYVHLLAIVLDAIAVFLDSNMIYEPRRLVFGFIYPVATVSMLAIIVAPIAMMVAVSALRGRSAVYRLGLAGGDCLLSAFQLWVITPLVS